MAAHPSLSHEDGAERHRTGRVTGRSRFAARPFTAPLRGHRVESLRAPYPAGTGRRAHRFASAHRETALERSEWDRRTRIAGRRPGAGGAGRLPVSFQPGPAPDPGLAT